MARGKIMAQQETGFLLDDEGNRILDDSGNAIPEIDPTKLKVRSSTKQWKPQGKFETTGWVTQYKADKPVDINNRPDNMMFSIPNEEKQAYRDKVTSNLGEGAFPTWLGELPLTALEMFSSPESLAVPGLINRLTKPTVKVPVPKVQRALSPATTRLGPATGQEVVQEINQPISNTIKGLRGKSGRMVKQGEFIQQPDKGMLDVNTRKVYTPEGKLVKQGEGKTVVLTGEVLDDTGNAIKTSDNALVNPETGEELVNPITPNQPIIPKFTKEAKPDLQSRLDQLLSQLKTDESGTLDLGKLFGKSKDTTDDQIRSAFTKAVLKGGRLNIDDVYKSVEKNIGPNEFQEKVNQLLDSGELAKIIKNRIRPITDEFSLRRAIQEDGKLYTAASLAKGFKSSGDLGPMFRQGLLFAGRPAWNKAFLQQFKSFASEGKDQEFIKALKETRLLKSTPNNESWAKRMGLNIPHITIGEEEYKQGGELAENLVKQGLNYLPKSTRINPVRASNRAYNSALSSLRSGIAEGMYDNYMGAYKAAIKTAKTAKEIDDVERLYNPENPLVGRRIADQINTATGRGSLKIGRKIDLEPAADALNVFFYSPRLLSSRIRSINRLLNPVEYFNADKVMRMERLKELASVAAIITASKTLYGGVFGAKQETSPLSSDFGKSRFTKHITADDTGGLAKFPILGSRIAEGAIKTSKGKTMKFGKNPIIGKPFDLVEQMGEGLASPVMQTVMALINGEEFGGRELNFTTPNPFENSASRLVANPMFWQDIYDVIQEDPSYIPLLFPAALGQTINVTEDRKKKMPAN